MEEPELALPLMRIFPFTIDNAKSDVFVWRSRSKMQQDGIKVTFFADNLVCRSSGFVNKVRVEDIELKFDLAFNFAILQSIYSRTL